MRDARAEAAARVDHRWDVRVLEPTPPAVADGTQLADDPVAGGEVVPLDRPGARSWQQVCDEAAEDGALREWCADRWLIRRPLVPLPESFNVTRVGLQTVAEHVLAPARYQATARIGLRFTYHGFGTPFFANRRQLRVEDGELVDESDRRSALTTVGEAARWAGVTPGLPREVYTPTTALDLDAPLLIDRAAATVLGDWYGLCASLLEQLRADAVERATADDPPGLVQLWPEHFDIAVDLGPDGGRANFGGSPGDADHPEPYVYVGPWESRTGEFWNEPFGASLSYAEILAGADPLAFLRRGLELLVSS